MASSNGSENKPENQMNLQGLYRQVIMDHYKSPRNKGVTGLGDGYHSVHLKNPTCGDDVQVAVKLAGDKVEDIRHEGIGCSICCSSASVMSETLVGHNLADAGEITNAFYDLIKGDDIQTELDMGDAISYTGVANFPARIKCATIPWKAFEQAVLELQSKN